MPRRDREWYAIRGDLLEELALHYPALLGSSATSRIDLLIDEEEDRIVISEDFMKEGGPAPDAGSSGASLLDYYLSRVRVTEEEAKHCLGALGFKPTEKGSWYLSDVIKGQAMVKMMSVAALLKEKKKFLEEEE